MTREEQIKKQADIYTDDASNYIEYSYDGGWSNTNDIELVEKAFIEGAKWADVNPKQIWISVEDDLPCNHEDMYNMSGSLIHTDDVIVSDGNKPVIAYMLFNDNTGEWKWNKPLNVKYWMPISKLTKE